MSQCVMLMRTSELGCWALIVFAFKSNSVRRQVGYLTTHLPVILIGHTENVLTIGVAISTDTVYVDTLLTMNLLLGQFPD